MLLLLLPPPPPPPRWLLGLCLPRWPRPMQVHSTAHGKMMPVCRFS
jgi:hypothetical protein